MRERLGARLHGGTDPSDADHDVLAQQLAQHDVLTAAESRQAFCVDTQVESPEQAAQRVAALIGQVT